MMKLLFLLCLLIVRSGVLVLSLSSTHQQQQRRCDNKFTQTSTSNINNNNECTTTSKSSSSSTTTAGIDAGLINRRDAGRAFAASSGAAFLSSVVASSTSAPLAAVAAGSDESSPALTVPNLLKALETVPTFCIVNPNTGASYMLYQRDADFAKGYAFTTYEGAQYVLEDAKKTASKGGYSGTWDGATITVIPASIAVRLALQPRQRQSQKGSSYNSIVEVVPGYQDREAAMKLDRQLFKDPSKVPLFFFDNLQVPSSDGKATPMYFNPDDLVAEWVNQYGKEVIPPRVQVIDFITLFQYVIRKRSNELPVALRGGVVFIPNQNSIDKAKELKSKTLPPYKPDLMVI